MTPENINTEQSDILTRLEKVVGKKLNPYYEEFEGNKFLAVIVDGEKIPINSKSDFEKYMYQNLQRGSVSDKVESDTKYYLDNNKFSVDILTGKYGSIKNVLTNLDTYERFKPNEKTYADGKKAINLGSGAFYNFGDDVNGSGYTEIREAVKKALSENEKSVQKPVETQQQKEIVHPNIKSVDDIKLAEINTNVPNVAMPPMQNVQEENVSVPLVKPKPTVVPPVSTTPIVQQAAQQPKIINNPAAQNAQLMEDQSPTQSTVVDDSVFAYNDNPLQQIAKAAAQQGAINQAAKQPAIVPPVTTQTPTTATPPATQTPPVATQPAQSNILAANAPYQANRTTPFTVTPEGQKYGVIDINGTVGHIQQDKRTPEQQNALFQLYQSIAPAQIDANDPIAVRNYNTQVYNQLHKEGKVDDFYRSKGLIAPNAPAQAAPAPKTATDIVEEAARTGKSYLQLYQESMPKPEYEQERADRIQTNSKASIIADILKLVGEGVTTKKGGTPIVRQSAVPMLNAELQKLNDLYKNEVRAYKQGGFNALLMDEQEKKRALIQKARDEAAKAVKQMEIDAAAVKDKENKKAELDKLTQQQNFIATQNELNRKNTMAAAQTRAAKSGSTKSTTNEKGDILIDGKIVKPKQAYVNDVTARVRSAVTNPSDPVMGMSPTEVFAANWNKYYDYVNGEFVPKSGGASRKTIPGISGQTTTTTQSNSSKKKIVGF